MTVGSYIKERRIERNMSQRELAVASGISNAEISRIESGLRKQPSGDILKNIAAALHIPAQNLFEAAGYIEKTPETEIPVQSTPSINSHNYISVSDLTEEEMVDLANSLRLVK